MNTPDINYVWASLWVSAMCAIIAILFMFFLEDEIILADNVTQADNPFVECVSRLQDYDHQEIPVPVPVSVLANKYQFVESTRDPSVISLLLAIKGYRLDWDTTNGAHYPDTLTFYKPLKNIGIILSDGTIIQFVFYGSDDKYFYGWSTYSTYRNSASYNNNATLHSLCGFWALDRSQVEMFWDILQYTLNNNEYHNPDQR